MIRSTTAANTRAVERLIHSKVVCSCDESKVLAERLAKLHELADRLERENAVLRAEMGAKGQ